MIKQSSLKHNELIFYIKFDSRSQEKRKIYYFTDHSPDYSPSFTITSQRQLAIIIIIISVFGFAAIAAVALRVIDAASVSHLIQFASF